MKKRLERIQHLFKERFGIKLEEQELYGYLRPRLIKHMDTFLDLEISDTEMIALTSHLTEKLHGKSILTDNKKKEPKTSNKIKE